MKSTNSQRLERWLGTECVERMSREMRGWYGPPIAVAGVPGRVYATGDGDFVGPIAGGYFGNLADFSRQRARRIMREWSMRQQYTAGAGFASLSDLISEATSGGKMQNLLFNKAATTATTAGNAFVARNVGALPSARGVGGTSGTGVKCTKATTGALSFANPTGGDTTHLVNFTVQATAASSLLLFDCLWDMTYNHASSLSTAVDSANRPDRYQSLTTAPGNFMSSEITTQPATAHTITVTYVDNADNTAEAATAFACSLGVAGRTNMPAGQWFVTLNAGDTGVRYITNIAQSTITSVTGVSTFFIGHPLALAPCPIANMPFIYDGINSAFNLEQVYDDACLSFMTPGIATTGNITYNGIVRIVSG